MISLTVYVPDAITADGYDNTLIEKNLEAYFVYKANGKVTDTLTAGFKKLITP